MSLFGFLFLSFFLVLWTMWYHLSAQTSADAHLTRPFASSHTCMGFDTPWYDTTFVNIDALLLVPVVLFATRLCTSAIWFLFIRNLLFYTFGYAYLRDFFLCVILIVPIRPVRWSIPYWIAVDYPFSLAAATFPQRSVCFRLFSLVFFRRKWFFLHDDWLGLPRTYTNFVWSLLFFNCRLLFWICVLVTSFFFDVTDSPALELILHTVMRPY